MCPVCGFLTLLGRAAVSPPWRGAVGVLLLRNAYGPGARQVPGAALWHVASCLYPPSACLCQFASKADKPLVEIYVADEWIRPEQAVVKYKMAAGFHRSSWDWIGLYRVGAEVLCSAM